jgi:hypothetical protein
LGEFTAVFTREKRATVTPTANAMTITNATPPQIHGCHEVPAGRTGTGAPYAGGGASIGITGTGAAIPATGGGSGGGAAGACVARNNAPHSAHFRVFAATSAGISYTCPQLLHVTRAFIGYFPGTSS